ncbi:MAG: hypothetical protein JXA20_14440 [Spirochaetes bacterium]|nr:hypothetical protein [Spirochaetota bacterium]
MVHSDLDMKEWKKEQLSYFQNYLKNFKEGTQQHTTLKKKVDELSRLI